MMSLAEAKQLTFARPIDVENIAKEALGLSEMTPLVRKHIQELVMNYGLSYTEIIKSIIWYIEVRKEKPDPAYGLAFIRNLYPLIKEYYHNEELRLTRRKKEIAAALNEDLNAKFIKVKTPRTRRKQPQLIDISQIDVEGEDDND